MWENILQRTILDNTVENVLWFFGIILIGLILKRLLSKILTAFVFRFLKKYSTGVSSEKLYLLLQKPLNIFILLITFYLAFQYIDFPPSWKMTPTGKFGFKMGVYRIFQVAIILSITWIILRIVDFFGLIMLHRASQTESRADDQIIPFLKESIKVIIFILSIFFILGSVFKLNIASLIMSLGIGGLAIALAAKESLENLLGSFTIFLDKPFVIGDLVEVGGITGNVEKIGFRSTRIRTLEKSYVTVPNKKMVEAELNNLSLRTYRTVKFNLAVTYQTPAEKIKLIVKEIQELLDKHEHIFHEESKARLYEFGESSLNIMVQYLVTSMEWAKYIDIREDINFKIIAIVQKHQGRFASSTTVFVNNPENPQQ